MECQLVFTRGLLAIARAAASASWNDLAPFGIEILTAEACGVSYRYLCDVTEKGRKVLSVAFGRDRRTLHVGHQDGTIRTHAAGNGDDFPQRIRANLPPAHPVLRPAPWPRRGSWFRVCQ